MRYRITYYLRGPFKSQMRWQVEKKYSYKILFRNLYRWEQVAFAFGSYEEAEQFIEKLEEADIKQKK